MIFLSEPLGRGQLDAEAIETAIELADQFAPSKAFDRARDWWQRQHSSEWHGLGFAKGVRWLAMLRRDSDEKTYTAACHQLRLQSRF